MASTKDDKSWESLVFLKKKMHRFLFLIWPKVKVHEFDGILLAHEKVSNQYMFWPNPLWPRINNILQCFHNMFIGNGLYAMLNNINLLESFNFSDRYVSPSGTARISLFFLYFGYCVLDEINTGHWFYFYNKISKVEQ